MELSEEETKALREFIEDLCNPERFTNTWKTIRRLYNSKSKFYRDLISALRKLELRR